MRLKKKIRFVKVCYTINMNKLALSILALFLWSPSVSAMSAQTLIDLHESDDLSKQIVYVAMHEAGEAIAFTNLICAFSRKYSDVLTYSLIITFVGLLCLNISSKIAA